MSDPYRSAGPHPVPGYPGIGDTTRIPPVQDSRSRPPTPPRGTPPHGTQRRTPPPRPPRPDNTKSIALKALGLVLVATVSGMLWWLINQEGPTPVDQGQTSQQVPQGKYVFTRSAETPEPLKDSDCATHAYGKIQKFLKDTPCAGLSRALYTLSLDNRTVYSSVSVVRMRTDEDAKALEALTRQDKTGNVNDLVKEKTVKVDGLETLANGGYASKHDGRDVIIVESDWAPKGNRSKADRDRLVEISKDAMRMSAEVTK